MARGREEGVFLGRVRATPKKKKTNRWRREARGPVRANEGEDWRRRSVGAVRVWLGEEWSLSTEPEPEPRCGYLITSSPSQSVNLSSPCSSVAQLPLIETSLKLVANT